MDFKTANLKISDEVAELMEERGVKESDVREILHIQMRELQSKLSEDGIELTFTPAFEDYMTEKGYDPAYGARPVKRLMQRELVNQLATAILAGTVRKDSAITVDVAGEQVVLRN